MWIVKIALSRPYTFVVLAILISKKGNERFGGSIAVCSLGRSQVQDVVDSSAPLTNQPSKFDRSNVTAVRTRKDWNV